ncbi:uncharacterized protein [Nicotiana tomentosiformis]|uniref:uncharacterized protein n=1 Tax=Nicotiana tomentosiformis TaxID=4098 RepID=UPI00388C8779
MFTYSIEEDPRTYQEAMSLPDANLWKKAMDDEIKSIHDNNTWTLAELPPNTMIIGYKWVLKKKLKADGSIDRYKGRLVAKGYSQKEGFDYFETFSPVTNITTIRVMFATASMYNLEVHHMDVKTTFFNGELQEEIYIQQPEDCKPSKTPIDPHINLTPNADEPINQGEYAKIIDSLMYVMNSTRPDNACVVVIPTGLPIEATLTLLVAGYSLHILWIRRFMKCIPFINIVKGPITLYCDNQATIHNTKNERMSGNSKHIAMRYNHGCDPYGCDVDGCDADDCEADGLYVGRIVLWPCDRRPGV